MLNNPETREQQLVLIETMRRALIDASIVLEPANISLLLASAIWEDVTNNDRDVDKLVLNANDLVHQSAGMVNSELANLKNEYVAKRKLTDEMLNDIEDLRTRLNNSNVEDTLRGLEGQMRDARLITPKILKLTQLIEEIYADIDDL